MIYVFDTETNGLLPDVTHFHCLCFCPLEEDRYYLFCNSNELTEAERQFFTYQNCEFFPLDYYLKLLNSQKTTGLICHNVLGYDLPVMEKLDGITYDYKSINGRNLDIIDTLVLSQNLNPERLIPKGCKGAHGLEAWGVRIDIGKPVVEDWSEQPLSVYLNRVLEDVKINKATYFKLQEEIRDVALSNGDKKGQWDLPLRMAHKVYYLMCQQEQTGVQFDEGAAWKLLDQIDQEMKKIEDQVEPQLGERILPLGQQPTFPKNVFKKAFDYEKPWTKTGRLKKPVKDYLSLIGYTDEANQEKYIEGMGDHIEDMIDMHPFLLTASAKNFCKKFGIEDEKEMFDEITFILSGGKQKVLKEKLRLKHKKDVKEYLIKDGWIPTIWKPRNIVIDKKTKKKLEPEEIDVKLDKYIKEFHNSVYWPFILKELGYKKEPDIESKSFRDKCIKHGRNLIASPQYADQRGTRCPNLKKLTGETSKLIMKWLSLQNRRTTLKSFDKDTGWLCHPRLKVDGRLPAGHSGITPTFRKRHTVCVNVPKAKDKVILGKEMRSLFIAPDNYLNVGGDGASIEAMVASHYTIPFDDGAYAEGVLSGKFHDENAKSYSEITGNDINRDEGKNFTYMIMYGGSGKKAAVMGSVSQTKGNEIVKSFWEINPGLKKVKEVLEAYWVATGKKYIFGLDGRKVFTRSKHSLLNTLFQHAGALILDYAQCYAYDKIQQLGFDIHRWGEFHDEAQAYEHKDEIETFIFDEKPEQERDGRLYSAPKVYRNGQIIFDKVKDEDLLPTDQWIQYYAPFGHILDEGFKVASKYFKTNVEFRAEYMVGENWRQCH